jgi:hypothetical protein
MRSGIAGFVMLLLLLSVLACSKPESRVIGTWVNEKTSSSIEFKNDKTGVIHQKTQANIPPDLEFKWAMLGNKQFKVEVNMPGASAPATSEGHLEGSDTLVIRSDTFKKMR